MKKNKEYILDLTNCYTADAIYATIEADLKARKQLGFPRKTFLRRIFGK